jgi:Flp pilus assembly protein TadD
MLTGCQGESRMTILTTRAQGLWPLCSPKGALCGVQGPRSTSVALAIGAGILLTSCGVSGSQQVGFQSRVDVGARMLESGQFASAYRLLDEVAAENPGSPKADLAIAEAYLKNDAFAKAENAYHSALDNGGGLPAAVGLGRVALARNAPELALQRFAAVLEQDPGNVTAINGQGVAYDLMGNHVEARTEYAKVLTYDPANVDALNNLALSHALSGSAEKAVTILRDLAGSQVNDPTLRQNLAIAMAATGHQADAVRLAAADIPEDQAEAMFALVSKYRQGAS